MQSNFARIEAVVIESGSETSVQNAVRFLL